MSDRQDGPSNLRPVTNCGGGRALHTLSKVAKPEHRPNSVTASYTIKSSDPMMDVPPLSQMMLKKGSHS